MYVNVLMIRTNFKRSQLDIHIERIGRPHIIKNNKPLLASQCIKLIKFAIEFRSLISIRKTWKNVENDQRQLYKKIIR